MKFIKIKNHLINLELIGGISIDEKSIYFYHGGICNIINFDSEKLAQEVYQDLINWLNGSYAGLDGHGKIPDLTPNN